MLAYACLRLFRQSSCQARPKIKRDQEVQGYFRARGQDEVWCLVWGYLLTAVNLGYNPLVAFRLVRSGRLHTDSGARLRIQVYLQPSSAD
jgi:hypothetical protein